MSELEHGSGGGGDRRSRLLSMKLRALVADHTGADATGSGGDEPPYPPGAALTVGDEAWVLIDERPGQRLGSALAWAVRRGAAAVHVVAERDAGMLARRAAQFELPVTVWRADGRVLTTVAPAELDAPPSPPPAHLELRELIAAGGATPLVEHGVVFGEVRGLEVCRVVDVAGTDGPRLEVGVGVHDREAFQMLHGDVPTVESLSRIVDAVRAHRVAGAPRHPFNRMAPERFLRWRIEQDPTVIGLAAATAAEPPVARDSVVDTVPCVAHGIDADGAAVVVVCTSGVDLDAVPFAADARLAATRAGNGSEAATTGVGGEVRLLLALPRRDRVAMTVELTERLAQPAEMVSLD